MLMCVSVCTDVFHVCQCVLGCVPVYVRVCRCVLVCAFMCIHGVVTLMSRSRPLESLNSRHSDRSCFPKQTAAAGAPLGLTSGPSFHSGFRPLGPLSGVHLTRLMA